MIDFKKHLGKKAKLAVPTDPSVIYEALDRASDKGPLRPAQDAVLRDWHEHRRNDRDLIIKLHTGQGKTLVGLLILQSKLNEGNGPVVFLCPNNFLVTQTCDQADQFGIPHVTAPGDLPADFLNSKRILIATVHKLFNGLTKFGLGNASTRVGAVVIDDSHACIDEIRHAFSIRLGKDHEGYKRIRQAFSDDLRRQGAGTFADIMGGEYAAFLPVPYWKWIDRANEVTDILASVSSDKEVRFVWPLIKDMLADCLCVISGHGLEIVPYQPPLDLFRSYYDAAHRVFMSATVADDSFFLKSLQVPRETIENPLTYAKESWSGEKMVLIPSLISSSLTRENVVKQFAPRKRHRNIGCVALVPSFGRSTDWGAYGATVATPEDIDKQIARLRDGHCEAALVVANRYDGIDLPDRACRILVIDSLPRRQSLIDRYLDFCRRGSKATTIKSTRIIEQGLGRAVRGEKDYCAVLLIGPELVGCGSSSLTVFSPVHRHFCPRTVPFLFIFAGTELRTAPTRLFRAASPI